MNCEKMPMPQLDEAQIASINEMIYLNIGNLLEHPMYAQMPNNMLFQFFRNLPSPFGHTINEWIGDGIMMTLTSIEHQNNGKAEEQEFSLERMVEVTKTKRNQPFIDQILEPLLPMDKAAISKKYHNVLRKYGQ